MASWIATGLKTPQGFHPNACRVHSPQEAYSAGWCEPYQHPDAVVLRVTPEGVHEVLREPGRCLAVDHAGASLWVLLAVAKADGEGSDFYVLRSTDSGQTWTDGPSLPAASLVRLCAVNDQEAWVLGVGNLLKTLDGGRTWHPVASPGERNGVSERLNATSKSVRILSQGSILTTRDGGEHWDALDLQGARACVLDVGGLLAVQDHHIKLGAPSDEGMTWLGSFEHDAEPVGLAVVPHGLRFVALPNHPDQHPGILYFESLDQGQYWDILLIPGRVIEGAVDLRREGGLMVGPDGDLFVLRD